MEHQGSKRVGLIVRGRRGVLLPALIFWLAFGATIAEFGVMLYSMAFPKEATGVAPHCTPDGGC